MKRSCAPSVRCVRVTLRLLWFAQLLVGPMAPAIAQGVTSGPVDDPLERVNRAIYRLNSQVAAVLPAQPVLDYARAMPSALWQGIDNFFVNLREPSAAAAALVGGNLGSAWNATARFAINSTLGIFGTSDVALDMGFKGERSDLGLELCRNGYLRDPIYFEFPLLGPSTLRDIGAQFLTNVAIYTLVGGYVFYPYYVLDRIDLYLERGIAAPAAVSADDLYTARRDAYVGLRRWRCAALAVTTDPG